MQRRRACGCGQNLARIWEGMSMQKKAQGREFGISFCWDCWCHSWRGIPGRRCQQLHVRGVGTFHANGMSCIPCSARAVLCAGLQLPKPRLASLGQVSTNCTKAEAVTAIHCSMFHNPYEDSDPRQPGCPLCPVHSLLTRCKRYCLRADERRHHRSPMQITSTATP